MLFLFMFFILNAVSENSKQLLKSWVILIVPTKLTGFNTDHIILDNKMVRATRRIYALNTAERLINCLVHLFHILRIFVSNNFVQLGHLFQVQHNLERACAKVSLLTTHYICRDTAEGI